MAFPATDVPKIVVACTLAAFTVKPVMALPATDAAPVICRACKPDVALTVTPVMALPTTDADVITLAATDVVPVMAAA